MVSDASGFKPIGKPNFNREISKQPPPQNQAREFAPTEKAQDLDPQDEKRIQSFLHGETGQSLKVDFDVMTALKAIDRAISPKSSQADMARALLDFGSAVETMDKDQLLEVAQKLTDKMASQDGNDETLNALLQKVFQEVGERNQDTQPFYDLLKKLPNQMDPMPVYPPMPTHPIDPGFNHPIDPGIMMPIDPGYNIDPGIEMPIDPGYNIDPGIMMPIDPGFNQPMDPDFNKYPGTDLDPGFHLPAPGHPIDPGHDIDPGFSHPIGPKDLLKHPDKNVAKAKDIVNDILNLRLQKRPTQAEVAKKVIEFTKTVQNMNDDQRLKLAAYLGDQMAQTDFADDTLGVLMTEVLGQMDRGSLHKLPPHILERPFPHFKQWPQAPELQPVPFEQLPDSPKFGDFIQLLANKF